MPFYDQQRNVGASGLRGLLIGCQEQIRFEGPAVLVAVESELVRAVFRVVEVAVRPNKSTRKSPIENR